MEKQCVCGVHFHTKSNGKFCKDCAPIKRMEWIENRKAENRKTPIEKTCLCGTVYFTVRDKKMCEACQEKQTKLNRNHRQKKYYKTNSITIKEKNKKINKDKYYAKSTEGKQLKRKCGTTKVSKEAKIVIAISRWIKKGLGKQVLKQILEGDTHVVYEKNYSRITATGSK